MEVPGGSSFGLEGHPVQVDKRILQIPSIRDNVALPVKFEGSTDLGGDFGASDIFTLLPGYGVPAGRRP